MKQSTSTRTRILSGRGMRAPSSLAALVAVSAVASALATAANAALTNYADEASWRAAAGAVTTVAAPNINLPTGGLYLPELGFGAEVGVLPIPSFLVDPWGLPAGTNVLGAGVDGQVWSRSFVFSQPIATAFAIDWLFRPEADILGVSAYFGSTHVGSLFWEPASAFPGPTRFYGFTSTLPFSRVVLVGTHVSFGRSVMFTQIPAPGAVALLALAPLAAVRRRR
jgi:hypothetical protein